MCNLLKSKVLLNIQLNSTETNELTAFVSRRVDRVTRAATHQIQLADFERVLVDSGAKLLNRPMEI